MYLYILFFIISGLSLIEISNIKIKQIPNFSLKIYSLIVFILIAISTFRWENGTDWDSYYTYFRNLNRVTCFDYMEPGFTLLSSINSVFFNYTTQLGCIAILSILPISIRIFKLSPYPIYSLFIWYCVNMANIFPVRQTIAVAIFVYSWKHIERRELKKFLIYVFLASTFHITAIVTIPIYFIWNKFLNLKKYILTIILFIVLGLLFKEAMIKLLFIIGGNSFADKLDFYINFNSQNSFGSIYTPEQILFRGIINRTITLLLPIFLLNKYRSSNNTINAIFNMYLYSFIIFVVVTPLSPALGRLTVYSDIAQILIFTYLFTLKMNLANRLILGILLITYLLFRFYGVVNNYYDLYVPYNFVFFK